jgi:hypothetical protein
LTATGNKCARAFLREALHYAKADAGTAAGDEQAEGDP